jgi:hypothetical protein
MRECFGRAIERCGLLVTEWLAQYLAADLSNCSLLIVSEIPSERALIWNQTNDTQRRPYVSQCHCASAVRLFGRIIQSYREKSNTPFNLPHKSESELGR